MKLQYLGDSKDCFKWDYHDYLANALDFPMLTVISMLTPDDETGQGNTPPLVFADPDIGFKPDGVFNEKHIRYDEVASLLDQVSEDSVVSVFQHFRHKKFPEDFARIQERLGGRPSTAVYWDGRLMFVTLGKSAAVIADVEEANRRYAESRPVVPAIR